MYNGDEVIEEYASGSLTKSYILGEYIDQPIALILSPDAKRLTPEVYYYHANAQQSIMALTDKSGSIAESYSYDAYGTRSVTFSSSQEPLQDYGYTGRRIDKETGLMYFRARYYSPELGRFISRDPLAFVDGMNLYAGYFAMWGDIDPFGLEINYCGTKKYRDYVKKQVEELKEIHPEIKKMIEDLEKKDHFSVDIGMPFLDGQKGGHARPKNIISNGKIVSIGAVVSYDPSEKPEKYFEGDKRLNIGELIHELKHASDHKNGWSKGYAPSSQKVTHHKTGEKVDRRGVKMSEVRAINVENIVRTHYGLEKRKHYGAHKKFGPNRIPDSHLEGTDEYKEKLKEDENWNKTCGSKF